MDDHRLTPDGIQARRATKAEMALVTTAEAKLLQVRAPLLLHSRPVEAGSGSG